MEDDSVKKKSLVVFFFPLFSESVAAEKTVGLC